MRRFVTPLILLTTLALAASPVLAQKKKTSSKKAPAKAAAVPPKTVTPELKCASLIGMGAKTVRSFCDLPAGRDPQQGIVISLPPHAGTGMLTPNDPPTVRTKAGAGPRHFTIHPNGKWGYLINETTATIGVYSIDKDKGTLSETGVVDTGDYNQKDSAFASDIHVTPNGKFLYGAVRRTSTLHGYKVDPDKGILTPIGKWPTEKTPRSFDVDPDGRYVFSAGEGTGKLAVYGVNPANGTLTRLHTVDVGKSLTWVLAVKIGD